jgi:hypothetical protein
MRSAFQPKMSGSGGGSSASVSQEPIQRSKASPEMYSPFSASASAASIYERLAARVARKVSIALLARDEAERFATRASSSNRALIFGSRRRETGVVDIRARLSMSELRRYAMIVASTPPSLRAQRSNPGATARGPWIASSQGLLAMTVNVGVHVSQVDFLISELRLSLRNRWRLNVAQPSSRASRRQCGLRRRATL